MIVLALTGSIGMGKSTTAGLFAAAGVPVHDADASVHALYAGAAVAPVESAFPGATRDGVIDRAELSRRVVGRPEALRRLEAIVHPLVRAREREFLARAAAARHRVVVLDIPLLFETGGERRADAVVVVTTTPEIQRARVLARPDMSAEKLDAILQRQVPDADKRRRAHFLIETGQGIAPATRRVAAILRATAAMTGKTPATRLSD